MYSPQVTRHPSSHALFPDSPSLQQCLDIPIESASCSAVVNIEVVATLAQVRRCNVAVAPIGRDSGTEVVAACKPPLRARTDEDEPSIAVVVERGSVSILHWLTCERSEHPAVARVLQPRCIERLPQIGSIAQRREPLQIERHF